MEGMRMDESYTPYGLYMNGDPKEWIPPSSTLISWMRDTWSQPLVCCKEDLHPMMNVNGLYWKLTGIACEQGGGDGDEA
jgi:hypothetical protein